MNICWQYQPDHQFRIDTPELDTLRTAVWGVFADLLTSLSDRSKGQERSYDQDGIVGLEGGAGKPQKMDGNLGLFVHEWLICRENVARYTYIDPTGSTWIC